FFKFKKGPLRPVVAGRAGERGGAFVLIVGWGGLKAMPVPYQALCVSDGQFKPAPGAGKRIYFKNPRQAGGPGAGFHFHLVYFLPQGG
ncbi:MAG: hypothetical protein CO042_02815, partial [Parcubacteria group bacterium CG_4_9_14_0_2_um_filter_41_8]